MKKIVALMFFLTISLLLVGCNESTVSIQTQLTSTDAETEAVTETVTEATIALSDLISTTFDFDKAAYEDYTEDSYTVINGDSESYTITEKGTYVLEGTITETVVVNLSEDDDVTLVLNNVTIDPSENQAILILSADDVTISVPEGTNNYLSDSETYTDENLDYDAAIYSECDLVINGTGYLEVSGNQNNTIQTKDDLIIIDVTLNIDSVDDGIIGKDSLLIKNANITLDVDGDGLKSSKEEDTEKGYIYIASGVFTIDSGSDAINAANFVAIESGEFTIIADSNAIKSDTNIYITGGTYDLTTEGDSISADVNVHITAGLFTISTQDDAIKADVEVIIDGGVINILECNEGINALTVTINSGEVNITESDDVTTTTEWIIE